MTTTTLDIEAIRRELATVPTEYDPETQCNVRRVCVGTHFSLLPSGKYYHLLGSANASQAEIDADQAWLEAADQACTDAGLVLEDGADPCDIVVAEYVEIPVLEPIEPDGDAQRDAARE